MKRSNEVGNVRLLAFTVVDVAHTGNDSDLAVDEHKGKDISVHGAGWRDSNACTPPRGIALDGLHDLVHQWSLLHLSGMLLAASFKLLIDLPCLLDFLNRLLKKPRNGCVGL